jgi:hypothetical protein
MRDLLQVLPSFPKRAFQVAAVLALISSPVLAASADTATTPPPTSVTATTTADDPLVFYRAYETAIGAGDIVAASTAAVTAWRTGERVWNGNNPNLPGLAFNAAWSLGLAGKISEAREPARRAVALAPASAGSVNPKEAAFLLAYADLIASPTKASVERLDTATRALGATDWGDFLLARSYVDGARVALNASMPRVARDMVDRGLGEVTRLGLNDTGLRTNLLVLRTQSSLQLRAFGRAVIEVMEARRAYGRPKSARDLNWASLAAWESASWAVYTSVYGSNGTETTGSRIARDDRPKSWTKEERLALSDNSDGCGEVDFKRAGRGGPVGISFPSKEANDGYAGGAFVRATIDNEGRVIATDILASLPRASYGAAAVEGIKGWQYVIPAGTPTQCRTVEIMLSFAFVG